MQPEQATVRYSSERLTILREIPLPTWGLRMDWGTLLSILGFGATIIPIITGILSALQSRSTPFVYKPTLGKPITLPAPTLKSAIPVPAPPLAPRPIPAPTPAPTPAPDPFAELRLAVRKELEAEQKRSFWPNLWTNLAISGFFYLAGVATTMVVSGH